MKVILALFCLVSFVFGQTSIESDPIKSELKAIHKLVIEKKTPEALKRADALVVKHPDRVNVLFFRADILAILQRWDDMLKDLNKLHALQPKSATVLSRRCVVLSILGKSEEALADADAAIALDSKNKELYEQKARLLFKNKKTNQAIAEVTKVIFVDDTRREALNIRANLWFVLSKWRNGFKDFEKILSYHPNDIETLNSYAWMKATLPFDEFRDGKKAVELANYACELSKWKKPHIIDTLAAAHAEVGDFDKATSLMKQIFDMQDAKPAYKFSEFEMSEYQKHLEAFKNLEKVRENPNN